MRLSNIAHLYVVRLKARVVLVQELFAVFGIAVGVALLFASQVASTSLNGSVSQLTNGVVGRSTYQLKARGQQGFSESLLGEVQRLPGVRAAVPVLEQQVVMSGPHGSQPVDLIATDPRYVHLAGRLLRHFTGARLVSKRVLGLPAPIAQKLGVGPLELIRLQDGRNVVKAFVGLELTARSIGPLVNSPIALTPLSYAQQLAGMQGRITRLLVQAKPGDDREVHSGLTRLAAGAINVEPANYDATLFDQAAGPINQTTILFSTICALIGFMFAYCSMLLTTHLRQGLVKDLRRDGATRLGVVKALLFDALVLGGVASLLGLMLGKALSALVFGSNPGYLSFGFPIGSAQIVTWQSVVIAVGAGMLAACIGVLTPLRVASAGAMYVRASSAFSVFNAWRGGMLAGGLVCLGITTAVLLTGVQSVQAAVVGVVSLITALLLLLPLLIDLTLAVFDGLQKPIGAGSTEVAVLELRSPRARARSIAIAATGAIAVFGSVAIQGGSANLQSGLDRLFHDVSHATDLWIVPPGEQDLLTTSSFRGVHVSTLRSLPGVKSIGVYHACFLEYGDRRVWVLAPPPTASSPLPPSQLLAGNLTLANTRLRQGGWAVISKTLATADHLHIGQSFTLPSPRETTFRVAALTTNMGWPPGAIILNGKDYVHAWGSSDPSAYNVTLASGASPVQVRSEIQRALGPSSGLVAQTAQQHEQSQRAASRKGLGRLTQIALLVLIAAVLAMATSMGALVWQRRRRFARMKVQGYESHTLWWALTVESVLLLGTGCLIGSLFGIYSEILQSHALATVTGFPIVITVQILAAFGSFALVTTVAAAIIAIPGYRVAHVSPYPWFGS
jgi:putative ABC transport system permease protein